MVFTGNKLSFNRKHKEILHMVSALNSTVSFTTKIKLKKFTVFCLLALLFTGCQKPATKEPENIAVNEETAQPAITTPEKQEPVQAK